MCAEAGLGRLALLAVDGTKIGADASWSANRTVEQIEAELADAAAAMLTGAAVTDPAENKQFGEHSGDELPEPPSDVGTRSTRRASEETVRGHAATSGPRVRCHDGACLPLARCASLAAGDQRG